MKLDLSGVGDESQTAVLSVDADGSTRLEVPAGLHGVALGEAGLTRFAQALSEIARVGDDC